MVRTLWRHREESERNSLSGRELPFAEATPRRTTSKTRTPLITAKPYLSKTAGNAVGSPLLPKGV